MSESWKINFFLLLENYLKNAAEIFLKLIKFWKKWESFIKPTSNPKCQAPAYSPSFFGPVQTPCPCAFLQISIRLKGREEVIS